MKKTMKMRKTRKKKLQIDGSDLKIVVEGSGGSDLGYDPDDAGDGVLQSGEENENDDDLRHEHDPGSENVDDPWRSHGDGSGDGLGHVPGSGDGCRNDLRGEDESDHPIVANRQSYESGKKKRRRTMRTKKRKRMMKRKKKRSSKTLAGTKAGH